MKTLPTSPQGRSAWTRLLRGLGLGPGLTLRQAMRHSPGLGADRCLNQGQDEDTNHTKRQSLALLAPRPLDQGLCLGLRPNRRLDQGPGLGPVRHLDQEPGPGRSLLRGLRDLGRAERGVAAIEAALLIPLMAFTIVGFVELYQYHRAAAVLDRTTFTLANGLSIQKDLYNRNDCTKTTNICTYGAIAADLMRPLNYNSNGQVIFSVYAATDPSGSQKATWIAKPAWERQYRGSSQASSIPAVNSRLKTEDFPPANKGDTIIVVEMFYDHEPFIMSSAFWDTLGGQRRLYARAYFRPRFSDIRNLEN